MAEILVVDDTATIREQLLEALANDGFGVAVADDGDHALARIEADDEIELLILDMHMPHVDGDQVLRSLRSRHPQRPLDIVVVTASADTQLREKCQDYNVKSWIIKPINSDAVVKIVRRILRGDATSPSTHANTQGI